jgi:hypothetical protein
MACYRLYRMVLPLVLVRFEVLLVRICLCECGSEVSSQVARLCRAHAGVRGLNKFDPRRIKITYRA